MRNDLALYDDRDLEQLERACQRQAAYRSRNKSEMLPDTRTIDRACVAALREFLRQRDVREPADIMRRNGQVVDATAAAVVRLIVQSLVESGVDTDNPAARDRLWSRLGLSTERRPRRGF